MNKNYTTYPNQKEIIVHKPKYTGNYMSVGNDEWIEASKKLTYSAFKLYLYMASNCDEYQFALSKKAVQDTIGISDNTYTKVVKELTDNHYLVPNKGNLYDFYTTPHEDTVEEVEVEDTGIPHSNGVVYPTTMGEYTPLQGGNVPHSDGVEISKQLNKNNLSKDADAKRVFNSEEEVENLKEELDEFDTDRLKELLRRFELGKTDRITHGYKALKKDFGIKSKIDKNLGKIVKDMIEAREYLEAQLRLAENCYIPEYTGGAQYQRKTKEHNPMFNDMW